jgi:hypothetical protein
LAILVTIFVCIRRQVSVPLVRLVLLLALLHLALQHQRHMMLLGVVAPLLLATPLAEALGQPRRTALGPAAAAGVTLAVALTATLRLALPTTMRQVPISPNAIAAIPADLRSKPVLNDYDFGGYLIYQGIRPYIDGRSDLYGQAFFKDFLAAEHGDAKSLDRIIRDNRISWSIQLRAEPVSLVFDRMPGWRIVYDDGVVVIHRRNAA